MISVQLFFYVFLPGSKCVLCLCRYCLKKLVFFFILQLADIEDLVAKDGEKVCPNSGKPCVGSCSSAAVNGAFDAVSSASSGEKWHEPKTLPDLLAVLKALPSGQGAKNKYRLVGGNTGSGVFENEGPYDVLVNVNRIAELRQVNSLLHVFLLLKYV